MMNQTHAAATALLTLLAISTSPKLFADDVPLDTADPLNGITEIYSATFDPPLDPNCPAGRLTADECDFFGGQTPATREIAITPNPTTVANGTPRGITPEPADGSFLDLELGAGNTQVTLTGGTVYIPAAALVISGGTANETNIQASDIGIVLQNFAPATVPISGGVAEFEIDVAPLTGADFSEFAIVLDSCTGPLCGLVAILTLDMIRFRIVLNFDATFGSFTADFKGQTANNSMVFATLNSGVPVIDVGDTSVDFGDVLELTTADQVVEVTHAGTGNNLVIGSITGPSTEEFSLPIDNCSGATLAPGENCTITARFAPPSAGPFADSFQIPSNDPASPSVTVNLSGNGTGPEIAVTDSIPPATDLMMPFDDVTIGTTRDETVTVTNVGNADLLLGDVGQVDMLAAPFSVENDTCSLAQLAPGVSCAFTVRFAPGAEMMFGDSVDIPSNDRDEPSVTVDVSGAGTAALVSSITVTNSLDSIDGLNMPFGDVAVNASRDGTITVTSSGTADLVLGPVVAPAAPFALQGDTCSGAILAPAATCTIEIRFAPDTEGDFADSVDISSNAAGGARSVQLSGTGFTPAPSISVANSLDPDDGLNMPFGSVTIGTMNDGTVTVTNDGTADLVLDVVAQDDMLAAPFGILNDGCSMQTLAPGADCTFDVQFAPTTPGDFTDSFDIRSNDPDEPSVTVGVSGTGVVAAVPMIRVTDSVPPADDRQIPYGDIWELFTIEETITVTNDGGADLVIGTVGAPAAPFEIVNDACSGQTLPPAMSCEVDVSFTAVTLEEFGDSVTIPSNDPDTPTVTVDLSATGIPPQNEERFSTEPSGADGGFFGSAISPPTALALLALIPALAARRRRAGARDRYVQ